MFLEPTKNRSDLEILELFEGEDLQRIWNKEDSCSNNLLKTKGKSKQNKWWNISSYKERWDFRDKEEMYQPGPRMKKR